MLSNQQQLIEDKSLLENLPKQKKVSIRNWLFMCWRPRSGGVSEPHRPQPEGGGTGKKYLLRDSN